MTSVAQLGSRRHAAAPATSLPPRKTAPALSTVALICAIAGLGVFPDVAPAEQFANVDTNGRVGADADEPPIPLSRWRDAVRLRVFTTFAPEAEVGGAEVSLVRPGARLRARFPIHERVQVQLTAGFATNLYEVDDSASLFDECPQCPEPGKLHEALFGASAGILLNDGRYFFREDERWALLLGGFARARWEAGAFDESITGGGSLGLGYQLPDRLRVALGVTVESSIYGAGPSVGPLVSFRWDMSHEVHLRDRGLGLQLGIEPHDHVELFIAGFRSSDRFRVDDRDGAPSDMTFRDRQLLVSAGVEWKIVRQLRLTAEAGAIVQRELSMKSGNDTLDEESQHDASAFAGLRLELRP